MTVWRPSTMAFVRKGRSAKEGFLLVEALAAMAISAMLLIALASLMSFMLRASDRAARTSGDIEEKVQIVAALTRDIEEIAPLRWAGPRAGFVFSGTDRSLVFAQKVSLTNASKDISLVRLASNGPVLTRETMPLPPNAQSLADIAAPAAQTIVQRRFDVRFAYFSRLDDGREALSDVWATPDQLPTAVRISLMDQNGVIQASVRTQLLVDAEPGCAAPRKALCSFVRRTMPAEGEEVEIDKPIDPDDKLGWLRYMRP